MTRGIKPGKAGQLIDRAYNAIACNSGAALRSHSWLHANTSMAYSKSIQTQYGHGGAELPITHAAAHSGCQGDVSTYSKNGLMVPFQNLRGKDITATADFLDPTNKLT